MILPAREWLYRKGILGSLELPGFVVSVGNISMGGTGKTPFALLLCEWALQRGISTALLSRGYKRKSTELEIVPAGAPLPGADRLGDEPWMIKNRLPGIGLLVHKDRARMAKRHWQQLGSPQLVVLDDAFQHWRVRRDLDVVMVDANESLDQRAFPFGRLREGVDALARADLVVITRAASVSADTLSLVKDRVAKVGANQAGLPWRKGAPGSLKVIAGDYEFQHFFDLHTGAACARPEEGALVLAAGIAKPDGVRGLAASLGLPVKEEIYFPDHHRLSEGDLSLLGRSLSSRRGSALLVTEKDWARWKEPLAAAGIRGYGLRVGLRFLDDGAPILNAFLGELESRVSRCSTSR